MDSIMKEETEIFQALGRFEAKISSLEKNVDRLEKCVDLLTSAMNENKGGWKYILTLVTIVSAMGALAHKSVEYLLKIFQ